MKFFDLLLKYCESPVVYYFSCFFLLVALVYLSLLPRKQDRRVPGSKLSFYQNSWFYLAIMVITLIACRLPGIMFNVELNVDESMVLAETITLKNDPIMWRSVDPTTIGPLSRYLLLPAYGLGFPLDYTTARFVGILLIMLSLILFFLTVKELFGETTARLVTLIPFFFFALATHHDFIHYSSEHLPLLIINAIVFFTARILAGRISIGLLVTIGLLLGTLPFAKLQAMPMGIAIFLYLLIYLWLKRKEISAGLIRLYAGLVLGVSFFPILVITMVIHYGLFEDFWMGFILMNIFYAGGGFNGVPLWESVVQFPTLFTRDYFNNFRINEFFVVITSIVVLAGYFTIKRMDKIIPKQKRVLHFFILLTIAAWLAVIIPGLPFKHYLLLLVFPLCFLAGYLIHQMLIGLQKKWSASKFRIVIVSIIVCVHLVCYPILWANNDSINPYVGSVEDLHPLPVSDVSKEILKYTNPDEPLVVWGWMNRYHVETQLRQGTTDIKSQWLLLPNPWRDSFHRKRYLDDFKRSKPPVFVDAVSSNAFQFTNPELEGHEAFPELGQYISNNYQLEATIDGCRIYVRNDRLNSF